MDQFEELLKSQPLRHVPPEWRAEILASAPAPCSADWRGWLWPSPYAWGALAAVWLVIVGLSVAAHPGINGPMAGGLAPTEQEVLTAMAERRREYEEFLSQTKLTSAPPPEPRPGKKGAWVERRESERPEIVQVFLRST